MTLSNYDPGLPLGVELSKDISNQNLECLTYDDAQFDIVITSDVMEHVRLDAKAHKEIYRILKPGGIYLFTVPHDRSLSDSLIRVEITKPDDPSKDIHLLEPEYHGNVNSNDGCGALSYRIYGRDLEEFLEKIGFEVEYIRENSYELGILNTELYYCRKRPVKWNGLSVISTYCRSFMQLFTSRRHADRTP